MGNFHVGERNPGEQNSRYEQAARERMKQIITESTQLREGLPLCGPDSNGLRLIDPDSFIVEKAYGVACTP